MATNKNFRVFLEQEDRPPASYYQTDALNDFPLKKPFQTPKADEWVKAPEFVPRSKLEESFHPPSDVIGASSHTLGNHQAVPFAPFRGDYTTHFPPGSFPTPYAMFPSKQPPVSAPLPPSMIPDGYSANLTHINSGVGPPIPAIVLRKKRRKRNRQTSSMALNSSESPSSSQPRATTTPDQKTLTEEEEEDNFRMDRTGLGGSCPDLTEEQLEMWDNYLYDAARASNQEQDVMKTSAYEIVPRSLLDMAEQTLDGISNPEIRKLDREINGNSMTASMVMQRLSNHAGRVDMPGSTERSLASELDQLNFRPQATKYGYPQIDSENVQLAAVHHGSVHSKIVPRSKLRRHSYDSEEEDCFEGMNITINAFDPCEELSLTDTESAPRTRFEQIQEALTRRVDMRPPDRVCCSIQ